MLAGNDPRLGRVATNSARLVDCVRVSESVEGQGNTAPQARTRGVNLNAIGTLILVDCAIRSGRYRAGRRRRCHVVLPPCGVDLEVHKGSGRRLAGRSFPAVLSAGTN